MTRTANLPSPHEMYDALCARDASYEGVFFAAIRTTGIFCRPSCPARKPKPENVLWFATPDEALAAGFRACKRCRPLLPRDGAPAWLAALLADVESDPTRRWRDHDLRARGLEPARVRRWFSKHLGNTFHGHVRARRLGAALGQLQDGDGPGGVATDCGWESESGFREAFVKLFGAPPVRGRETPLARVTRLLTPLGPMLAVATEEGVALLEFTDRRAVETQVATLRRHLAGPIAPGENAQLEHLRSELTSYFAGELKRFHVPLVTPGTPFQEDVWEQLAEIPFGETRSYADIARAVGRPKAVRAVGRANGMNRIAILLPCHRVVGSDGQLTGYGGGVWRKRRLLELEGARQFTPVSR